MTGAPPDYAVRPASEADFDAIQRIEAAAAHRYRDAGLPEAADSPVLSTAMLAQFVSHGALFVATHEGRPVAFVASGPLDDAAHVAEVDVVPEHAGRRLGARLIDEVATWASARGIGRLTLTTYRDVPWNAPYYARLGFRVVPIESLGPAHRALWTSQGEQGLDLAKRVAMECETPEAKAAHDEAREEVRKRAP